jgi:hypothetical protein
MSQFADMNYAKLLSNPCTGPLVHGPGSSEGGQVVRFESDFIIGNGVTETAGAINWAPGGYNGSAGTFGQAGIQFVTTGDLTAATPTSFGSSAPGFTFLQANASSYRCLAACIQLYWPGTELNRSGIVAAAQATYGFKDTTTTTTTAQLRAVCPVVERMPTDMMEVKWAPNFSDGLFRNPSSLSSPEDGHSALLINWAGLPVSTGVRLRLVAVFEWRPKTAGLVLSSNTSMNSSATTIQEVRSALDRRNANWWNHTGQAAAEFLSGLTVAYAARRASSYAQPRLEL